MVREAIKEDSTTTLNFAENGNKSSINITMEKEGLLRLWTKLRRDKNHANALQLLP
jgi:hypothetical protein